MYVNGAEVFGADYPTQIWHDVAEYALSHVTYGSFPLPDPATEPPIKFIFSPGLERDDLLSHGGAGPSSCVWAGQIVPCPTTTTTTAAPIGPRRVPTPAGGEPRTLAPATTAKTTTAIPGVIPGA
jgi:hypothetical protein